MKIIGLQKIGFLVFLLATMSCSKWDLDQNSFPEVITGNISLSELPTDIVIEGEISGLVETQSVEDHGHIWIEGDQLIPDLENYSGIKRFAQAGNGAFTSVISSLTPGIAYTCRAFALFEGKAFYGEPKTFETQGLGLTMRVDSLQFLFKSIATSDLKVFAAISGMPVGISVGDYGIVWARHPQPTVEEDHIVPQGTLIAQTTEVEFTVDLVEMELGAHYCRSYARVGGLVIYSPVVPFGIGDLWDRKADFPGPLFSNMSAKFHIGQKAYVGMGEVYIGSPQYVPSKDLWEYDPLTDSWTQKAGFPGEQRMEVFSFAANGKGYVGLGGYENSFVWPVEYTGYRDIWEFDPGTNTWTQKQAVFPGTLRRSDFISCYASSGMAYLALGRDTSGSAAFLSDVWQYDPVADEWQQLPDFPGGARTNPVGFCIGDNLYVGLGTTKNDFWKYDPLTGDWQFETWFPGGGRAWGIAVSTGERAFVGLGEESWDLYEYLPALNIWVEKEEYPEDGTREQTLGVALGEKVLIVGATVVDVFQYYPD